MKTGLLIIPDSGDMNEAMDWDHNVDYSKDNLHIHDTQHEFRTWHSYAAVTGGIAVVYGMPGWEKILECDMVLVTVFSNIYSAIDPIMKLKDRGAIVCIAYHECLQMLQHALNLNPHLIGQLCDVIKISGCDFLLYSTPLQSGIVWDSLYDLEKINVHYVPFAYPAYIASNYKVPISEHNGIFLGCSSRFDLMKHSVSILLMASRLVKQHNTCAKILTSSKSIYNYEDWFIHNGINKLIVYPSSDYNDFLKILASCKICLTLDYSLSQGQNAFDSALVGIPCIGGCSDSQRMLYPELSYDTTNIDKIMETASKCLEDNVYNQHISNLALERMKLECNFDVVKNKLESLYDMYKNRNNV